jgi:hypothetical protein
MKNLLAILSFIAIFAACTKDKTYHGPLGAGLTTSSTIDYTLNVKYVEDCSMRPVPSGTAIVFGAQSAVLKTDSLGNAVHKFKRTGATIDLNYFNSGFTIDSVSRGFGISGWQLTENLLFVKNDSTYVNITFFSNTNSVAQLKDSVVIVQDGVEKWLPQLTRDTTLKLAFKTAKNMYRKDAYSDNYSPIYPVECKAKKPWLIQQPVAKVIRTGVCGTQLVVIQ